MKCKLCNQSVADSVLARWGHIVRAHPEKAINVLRPLVNDDVARELGKSVALRIKERLR